MINCTLLIYDPVAEQQVRIETCFPTLPRKGDLITFKDSDRKVHYRVRACGIEFFDDDGDHEIHIYTEKAR